ncbi:hypothetical protein V7968_16460 [Nocardia vulneris]|uniref:hypothetical protein n=1 Tax=Nocardia vulneris TaxID=1141657 RepID=UPI0030CB466B
MKLLVAGVAAVSAVIVAVLSASFSRASAQRDRRRQMYGEAFRAALEWREMLYRVRRRDNTEEGERAVIDKFHDLQERLDYYEGWIGSESKYMRRSYQKLIREAKSVTRDYIRDAWDNPGRRGNANANDEHPMISINVQDRFLRDVRHHLSLQPWRWPLVAVRNREDT